MSALYYTLDLYCSYVFDMIIIEIFNLLLWDLCCLLNAKNVNCMFSCSQNSSCSAE